MKISPLLFALALVPAFAHGASSDPKQAYIDSTFSEMDADKDGKVDKSEYTRYQQSRFNKQADSITEAFKAMDANSDGKISKTEAAVVPEIARYFDGLDTDKDGFLSLKELQQAMVAAQTAEAAKK
ncbi:EF-hand domain-containing protein [Stenotrophomonas sp. 24(2023)]|uniref:EF-hand domain-containing protein n=1 Tax=Stenotrophomonas sp. 24(2023) TaxID=3068324 RepID=UPI0027E113B7|nr:EF-hand domain-containing protein [Stenotrophomonas sp. 24(2023)]WMJ68708.1 EF-hand domain-containing protein [Stenotrophomonas sp. 24(2023)]